MSTKKNSGGPAKSKPRRTKSTAEKPAIDRRKTGNPGYAGYEYQIDVSIWVALDLIFARDLAGHVVIEPPSHEDIEVAVEAFETTLSLTASGPSSQISVQAKTRSNAPWTSTAFADVLLGKETGEKGRARPLEMLQGEPSRRYVMVTNEATAEGLRPHEGLHLLDFPETNELPPYTRKGISAIDQANLSPRIVILPNVTREILDARIATLLMRHGHVTILSQDDCISDLRDAVRARMRGEHGGVLTKAELVTVIARHGGSIQATRAMDHYVEPLSYAKIRERLDNQHAVVIAGPSGTGKTLTADLIEYEMRKQTRPYIVRTEKGGPGEVRAHFTDPGPTLFHLRDPWGGNRLEPGADRWSGELPKLLEQASSGRKFLVTSRTDVMQVAGAELIQQLKPYIVTIEIDDYGPALLERIYDNLVDDLALSCRSLARTYRRQALDTLERPYEISRFLGALENENSEKPRQVEEIIAESQINAISTVVADQLAQFGRDGAIAASIIWALLIARDAVEPSTFDKLMRRIRSADPQLRPDVDGLIDFLVAGQNLRRDTTALSFYHPRAEEGLRKAFVKYRTDVEFVLSRVVDILLNWDEPTQDWGAETALGVLRAARRLERHEVQPAPALQTKLDAYLNACSLSAERRRDFEQALRDLVTFGSASNPATRLARLLMEDTGTKVNIWVGADGPPEISQPDKDRLRGDDHTRVLLRRYIKEVLPFSHHRYHRDLVPLLDELADGLGDAYWDALDVVAGPGGPSENMEVILRGALATGGDAFDRALERFAKSASEADAWLESFAEELYEAEEHVVDADAVDHIMDEPSERFHNHTHGIELLLRSCANRDHELMWIVSSPHQDLLLDALASNLNHAPRKPARKLLRRLVELSTGWTRQKAWDVASRHWDGSLIDLLRGDLLREDIEEVSLRRSLVETLACEAGEDLTRVPRDLITTMSVRRRFELVDDIMNTRLPSDRTRKTGLQQRSDRAEKVIALLPADERNLAYAVVHLMHGEDIAHVAAQLADTDRELLARLMPTAKVDALGPLTLLAAASGMDIAAPTDRLLATEDGRNGEIALQALQISEPPDLRAQIARALTHRRYVVRRRALHLLAPQAVREERAQLVALANDHSADVRLAFTDEMRNLKWAEAIPALVALLSDTRNYASHLAQPSWSWYAVARAAASCLGRYETLPSEVVSALQGAVTSGNSDPMVPAAAISALAMADEPGVIDLFREALIGEGIKRAARYRPAAQAAAWAIFDRTVAGKNDVFRSGFIETAIDDVASIAGPLLITLGLVESDVRNSVLERLEKKGAMDRAELVRLGAIVAQTCGGLRLSEIEKAILLRVQNESSTPSDETLLQTWSLGLRTEEGFERFVAWIAEVILKLPVANKIGDIRATELPSRISVLNLRSLTPYGEELGEDDGN